MGSRTGESKNRRSGVRALKHRQYGTPIHVLDLLDGTLNVYNLIETYIEARRAAGIDHSRFFLGSKAGKKLDVSTFFRSQPIGKYTMTSIVKTVCQRLGIRGQGCAKHMTTHGLRSTMISMLISSGYSDAAVCLRSGHRDPSSLLNYHNLRGQQGEEQLGAVFAKLESKRGDAPRAKDHLATSGGPEDNIVVETVAAKDDKNADQESAPKKQRIDGGQIGLTDVGRSVGISGAITAGNCTFNINISK